MSPATVSQDDSAGDFFAGVARRLRTHVVCVFVDHDRAAENIAYTNMCCPEIHAGSAVFGKQRGEIAGVIGMLIVVEIEMRTGVGKIRAGAAATLVDMKRKKFALALFGRKSLDIYGYDQSVLQRVK